jgi:hypothetical protein
MINHTCGNNIVYLVDTAETIPVIHQFADLSGYEVYAASELLDLYASYSKIAVVEKELLEQWFIDDLVDVYGSYNSRYEEVLPGISNLKFDATIIVVGDCDSIPYEARRFFTYVPTLTVECLQNLIPYKTDCIACKYDSELNLLIDGTSEETIRSSFDRIATELFQSWMFVLNRTIYRFTELEFYFYQDGIHEDTSVHNHQTEIGQWRFHGQGLDISLGFDNTSNGGILIRGIQTNRLNINGPRRVVETIFRSFETINRTNNFFGLIRTNNVRKFELFKTVRHGISESCKYKNHLYRYFCDIDRWNPKHLSKAHRDMITSCSQRVKTFILSSDTSRTTF